jgi:hypothetical protein
MAPLVGSNSSIRIFISVVLPPPEGPVMAMNSPGAMVRLVGSYIPIVLTIHDAEIA